MHDMNGEICKQRRAREIGILLPFSGIDAPPRDPSCQQPRRGQEPGRRRPRYDEAHVDEYGTVRAPGDFS